VSCTTAVSCTAASFSFFLAPFFAVFCSFKQKK
jgi:hypothetical protein